MRADGRGNFPWAFALIATASGCGQHAADRPAASRYVVEGRLSLKGKAAHSVRGLRAFLVDAGGTRRPAAGFRLDPATGAFSFSVGRGAVLRAAGSSTPEVTALMGIVPPSGATSGAPLTEADAGYVRFEIFDPAEAAKETDSLATYFQSLFPLPRAASLGSGRVSVDGGSGLEPYAVGKAALTVADDAGNPVRGAKAHLIPLQAARAVLGTALPRLPWADARHAPAFQTTDARGKAWLFPVPLDGEEPKYQVAVSAKGACPSVSPQALVRKPKSGAGATGATSAASAHAATNAVSVSLSPCGSDVAGARGVKWSATPAKSENVLTENGASRIYTNADKVAFGVTARSTTLRGFKVLVYAGTEESGKPAAEYELFTFADTLEIALPLYLAGGKRDGQFLVVLESLYSADDTARFGKPPRAVFAGVRSSAAPEAKKERFRVVGAGGVPGLVSGSGPFTVTYDGTDCGAGMRVGVAIGSQFDADAVPFQPCDPKGNVFRFEELGALITSRGGEQDVVFFLENRFGNRSPDDREKGTNRARVYVDFGTPALGTSTTLLSSDFGFAASSQAAGTELQPYDFLANPVQIASTNPAAHVLRFAGPTECASDVPDETSDGSDPRGRAIGAFGLVPAGGGETVWTTCGADLALAAGLLSFPAGDADAATFAMRVRDASGNASTPTSYSIPSCAAGPSPVCWKR